jgi:photosystem II stability/assembly factor-like uncharacterized protein
MKSILIIVIFTFVSTNLFAENIWAEKELESGAQIGHLQCLDSNDCYAFFSSGDGLGFYRSTDQGGIWIRKYFYDPPTEDSVWSLHHCWVVDSNNIYIGYSQQAIIEKSTDGGKTFKRIVFGETSMKPGNTIQDFSMYNERMGFILTTQYYYTTLDGWDNFKIFPHDYKKFPAIKPIFFIDSLNAAINKYDTTDYSLLKFNIKAETWSTYSEGRQLNPDEQLYEMNDAYLVNDTLGFACGGQLIGIGFFTTDIIWKTTDAGLSWSVVNESFRPEEKRFGLEYIRMRDEKYGLAAGAWGIAMETTDEGDSWHYIEVSDRMSAGGAPKIAFAGQYPLIGYYDRGLHRLEVVDDVEEYQDANIKIYQSFDEFKIELINKLANNLQFQIVDLLGREIFLKSYENQRSISIDLSQINSGFYMYRIISDGRVLRTGKIVR